MDFFFLALLVFRGNVGFFSRYFICRVSFKKKARVCLCVIMEGNDDNAATGGDLDLRSTELYAASTFLKSSGPPPKMPWEMHYEERRRHSKDPRIMKQLAEEDQWVGTSCSSLWRKIRVFALPKNDWIFSREQFLQFLTSNGVKGPQFMAKVVQVFDPSATGIINGLVMCKQLHLALTTKPLSDKIAHHCFERFDRPIGSENISLQELKKCKLLTPQEVAARSVKKGKKSPSSTFSGGGGREAMMSGARYENVDGLKRLVLAPLLSSSVLLSSGIGSGVGMPPNHNDDDPDPEASTAVQDRPITFPEFLAFFTDERNGEWIGSFVVPIMECCVKYCIPPAGALPLIALRWLRSIEPLPVSNDMYDSDVMLLREIEATGIDPTMQSKEKKKKKGGGGGKKK